MPDHTLSETSASDRRKIHGFRTALLTLLAWSGIQTFAWLTWAIGSYDVAERAHFHFSMGTVPAVWASVAFGPLVLLAFIVTMWTVRLDTERR